MTAIPTYCPRCGSIGAVPLPSTKSILCSYCRDYNEGIIPLNFSDEPVIHKDILINLNKALIQLTIANEEQAQQIKAVQEQINNLTK